VGRILEMGDGKAELVDALAFDEDRQHARLMKRAHGVFLGQQGDRATESLWCGLWLRTQVQLIGDRRNKLKEDITRLNEELGLLDQRERELEAMERSWQSEQEATQRA
jgi:hypothetical protein